MRTNKFNLVISMLVGVLVSPVIAMDTHMEDIIVTAKANATTNDIAGIVEVIDRETIAKSGALSVADVLKQVPGFNWTVNSTSTYGRKNIGMRGMDSERILVLIDGERANDTDSFIGHSDYKISFVDLNSVERIEIIKGAGGSVLYGSEAIGGVINIITENSEHKNYNRLTLSSSKIPGRDGGDGEKLSFTSAFGNQTTYAKISANLDKNDPVKNAVSIPYLTGNPPTPTSYAPGNTTDLEGKDNENIDFKITHHINATDKVSFGLFDGKEKRALINSPYYEIDRSKYSLAYQTKIGDLGAKFKTYQNSSDSLWITSFSAAPAAPYYTHKIKDKVLSAEIFGDITNNQYLTAGVEQHKQSYTKDYVFATTDDYSAKPTTQKSIYAQDKITLGSGVVIAGVRFDDNSQFGNGTSPSLGYTHNLSGGKTLKFSYAKAFKAPNIKEADSSYYYSHGYPGASVFIGNSDLKPESSNNLEIDLTGKGKGFDYSIAIYQTKIKDLIDEVDTGGTHASTGGTLYQYRNINRAAIKGLEASANIDLSNTLLLNIGYSHLNTDDGNDGELAYRPDHTIILKLDKTFSDSLNANLLANYTGSSVDGQQRSVPSYITYDLVANKYLDKNTTLKFAIDNLTNERLDDANGRTDALNNHSTLLVGRKYTLGLSFNF